MMAEEATPQRARAPAPSASADLDPVRVVEAALFSAGRPITLDEIAENTGLTKTKVQTALKKLVAEYEARDSALEIGRAADKWSMQVSTRYAPAAQKLAPMEIAPKLLKTLALIAYHQPVLQSQLRDMVGEKAYDHIRELHERGLVKRRVHERSFLLMTSDRFPDYFGIPASDREEIKVFLAHKLGIAVPKTDGRGNAKLGAFRAKEEAPAPAPQPETGTSAPAESAESSEPAASSSTDEAPVDDAPAAAAPPPTGAGRDSPEKDQKE